MRGNAEAAAEQLLKLAWIGANGKCSLPVEPSAIARNLGLRYDSADLPPMVSGMLRRQPGHDFEIHVARDDGAVRQRFTCAHELGHYVFRGSVEGLHPDEGDAALCFRDSLSAKGTDPEEIWANNFAAALLMPRTYVENARKDFPDVAILAGKFRVSPEAMRFRLKGLGRRR